MTRLEELRAQKENIEHEMDRAGYHDTYIPAATWRAYWAIKEEMKQIILAETKTDLKVTPN